MGLAGERAKVAGPPPESQAVSDRELPARNPIKARPLLGRILFYLGAVGNVLKKGRG
jgi:hypothetical protein